MLFVFESPRWYIRKGNQVKATRSIATLHDQDRDSAYVQQELRELTANYYEGLDKGGGGWLDCFEGGWKPGSNLRKVLLGISIQMMQQLSK